MINLDSILKSRDITLSTKARLVKAMVFPVVIYGCTAAAAAAAAKSLQSCPTLRPRRRQSTRISCPWDSPGKNTGVGCYFLLHESWTIKKAECWRTDAFELWCWRRLLGVPWTARRSNQSILKEISSGYSLDVALDVAFTDVEAETPILWPPDAKSWLLKTLKLGKIEGRRRRRW